MIKDTILLISRDAELRAWFKSQVLPLTGLECDEAPDLAIARARIAAQQPQLMVVGLSAQLADELAFISEYEPQISAVAVLPERSLDLIEAALAHGVCGSQRGHARCAAWAHAAGASAVA